MTKTLIVHLGIGKAGNKLSIDAAILLNEAGYSIHAKTYPAPSFKSDALAEWAKKHLATQGLLEVCLNSPSWVAVPTLYCAGTAPDPWPPSPPPRLLMQAI